MNFITAITASRKWGITANRITILCKEGRIAGAEKIGNLWMIPENADKPGDARTKTVKENISDRESFFRFPVFEGHDENSFTPPLSCEEIQLKNAMQAYHACRFEDAEKLLGNLYYISPCKYIRIYALHIACMINFRLIKVKEFFDCYTALSDELKEDFPHKNELSALLHLIDGSVLPNNYFFTEFKIDFSYSFDESFSSKAAALCFIKLFYTVSSGNAPDNLNTYEFICAYFDKKGCYVDSQLMHYYLGIVYMLLQKGKEMKYHLLKAFELAEKYELYCSVAEIYYYYKQTMDKVLCEFSPEFTEKIQTLGNELHNRYNEFGEALSRKTSLFMLPSEDYIYIFGAVQGLTTKEVAKTTKQSTSFVSAKYEEIYQTLGVKSKRGLIQAFKNLFNNPNA